jgi:hypothetical protein
MSMVFATPYEANKILAGVLAALNQGQPKRPNWLQGFYPTPQNINARTVNFDQQYATRNVMGKFVSPTVDVDPVALPNYGSAELTFSYSKEGFPSDDLEDLEYRMIGQQFGQVNIQANQAARFLQKAVQVEQRFENLFEKTAAELLLYGGYLASSEKHPAVRYDFNRTKATLYTEITGTTALDLIPSVNLTTSAVSAFGDTILPVIATGGSYTAGDKAWSIANVDSGKATPYLDVVKMVQTCNEWDSASAIQMSADAYDIFNYDLNKNYKEAADTTVMTVLSINRDILPRVQVIDGLTFRVMLNVGNGIGIPIYTYRAIYHDRTTGARTRYIGNGWVNVLPASGYLKLHGRILHPSAGWQAMPRWMNHWMDTKTGREEWEWHTNFIMGSTKINSLVSWKVM